MSAPEETSGPRFSVESLVALVLVPIGAAWISFVIALGRQAAGP